MHTLCENVRPGAYMQVHPSPSTDLDGIEAVDTHPNRWREGQVVSMQGTPDSLLYFFRGGKEVCEQVGEACVASHRRTKHSLRIAEWCRLGFCGRRCKVCPWYHVRLGQGQVWEYKRALGS